MRKVIAIFLAFQGYGVAMGGASVPQTPQSLVFDSVTVVDVEHGQLHGMQRVVIVGNQIRSVGDIATIATPKGAQVIAARGKYLIPGLWDMHALPLFAQTSSYENFLAHGITGIRDMTTMFSLEEHVEWRQEILAGTRVGPPRQILGSALINDNITSGSPCTFFKGLSGNQCFYTRAEVRQSVASAKAAGADMVKAGVLSPPMYFALADEARRVGVLFGGSVYTLSVAEASDSGTRVIDHFSPRGGGGVYALCALPRGSLERCQPVAERLRRNGTWLVPTLLGDRSNQDSTVGRAVRAVQDRQLEISNPTSSRSSSPGNWLRDAVADKRADSRNLLSIVQRAGLPILAGSNGNGGSALHAELAIYVLEGLTPLEALRSATLYPARALAATDSLGAIAPGKLADLVLLDADPLTDITNTTTIRAVIANGRYFDRSALDQLVNTPTEQP